MVGNDLSKLVLDVVGIDRLSANRRQCLRGFLELALLDEVTWGFGKEEQSGSQDDGPQELDCDWDSVGSSVVAVLSRVHDAIGQQNANGDAELVPGHKSAADFLRGDFLKVNHQYTASTNERISSAPAYRHVQNDNGGDETNAQPSNETTNDHDGQSGRCDLEDTSDCENQASHDDRQPTSDKIGDIAGDDGAKEGPGGQNGRGQRLVAGGQVEVGDGGLVVGVGVLQAGVLPDEVFHAQDAGHPSGVITEENTTEGGKGTDQVSFGGDRRLDTRGIRRPGDDDWCRHGCRGGGGGTFSRGER